MRALDKLRNRLEHGFVSCMGWIGLARLPIMRQPAGEPGPDPSVYAMARGDLAAKTLRILACARGCYLALTMHAEEGDGPETDKTMR